MKDKFNSNLIYEYLVMNNISKSKFCNDCKISLSTLNGMLSGKNFSVMSLVKISIKMKRKLFDFFI